MGYQSLACYALMGIGCGAVLDGGFAATVGYFSREMIENQYSTALIDNGVALGALGTLLLFVMDRARRANGLERIAQSAAVPSPSSPK